MFGLENQNKQAICRAILEIRYILVIKNPFVPVDIYQYLQ